MGVGWRLDDILDLTMGQITLSVECVEIARLKHLDMLLSPIVEGVSGGKYSPSKVSSKRSRAATAKNASGGTDYTPYAGKDGEAKLQASLAMMGLRVEKK